MLTVVFFRLVCFNFIYRLVGVLSTHGWRQPQISEGLIFWLYLQGSILHFSLEDQFNDHFVEKLQKRGVRKQNRPNYRFRSNS